MFKCLYCGLENPSEKARFCSECGPDGPAKDWNSEDIDQPAKVTQYASLLGEFYFDAQDNDAVEKFSLRIRERLKVSYDTHSSVVTKLAKQKKAIAHLANFRFEFNENVIDAYAGHDTFLNFRYTNLSEDDLFKVALLWDDPNTSDRIDLKAETKSFIKPKSSVSIGASAIFDRIGIKELSDLQITVSDQFGESANFRVEPFGFKVGNHDQKITQNISTHNQISIEGRGVVDASGMGKETPSPQIEKSTQPKWRELSFSYVPEVSAQSSFAQNSETVTTTKTAVIAFDKDNILSVLSAAEQGDPEAQKTLGNMYRDGQGVAENAEQAVYWFRKAAEQGHAGGQNNLGIMYENGNGVAKDEEQALSWYSKAAEQGLVAAQNNLGNLYEFSSVVAKNYDKAVHWYLKASVQGDALGQVNLGSMYRSGKGLAKNDELAVHWFLKAAEQGNAFAQLSLGGMYEEGEGVPKNNEQALHWYRKAAEQGNEDAIEALKELEFSDTPSQAPTDGFGSWSYENYTYTGLFKNGQWSGLGELVWSGKYLGHRYVGEFVNGQRHGHGTYTYPDGTIQSGTFENNVYQETQAQIEDEDADLTWEDGSSYVGEVEAGLPHGFGTLTLADGDSMYGSFENGKLNDDTAHYDFADGGTYDGPMVNGVFSGHGTRTFGGDYVGHSYTGDFANGYFNGEGTYTFPDGSTNVGQFKDGIFVPPSTGKQEYEYVGATLNGIPHGVGKMTSSNGEIYKGDFLNGMRHGLGELTHPNGAQVNGRFENNEFVKNASVTEMFKIGYKISGL